MALSKVKIDPKSLENATYEDLVDLDRLLTAEDIAESPAEFAEHLSGGAWLPYKHLKLLEEKLSAVAKGKSKRLIVTMPPRHGKSEFCSKWFPAWYLNRFPDKRVMLCSYEADFAATWGRKTRDVIESNAEWLKVKVAQQSSAANRWDIAEHAGGMVTAGVGGPITGRGADLLIIDDPVKNQEEAHSQSYRDRAWDWWRTTAFTRLEPGGSVIVIQTRWHEDDLAGRLVAEEPEQWEVINLPALAEEDDAMGRNPGEALCPERYDENALGAIRTTMGSEAWSALYQQRPQPEGGGRFQRRHFRYWSPRTDGQNKFYSLADPDGLTLVKQSDCWRFITVDLAAVTHNRADFTVAAVWDVAPWLEPGRIMLVHRERIRVEGAEHLDLLKKLQEVWKPIYIGVERATFGLTLIQSAVRVGLPIRELRPDKDKWARSEQAAVLCENGRAYFPKSATWLNEWESELLSFPSGAHDDQVDCFSYAALEIARGINLKGRKPERYKTRLDAHFAKFCKPKPKVHPMLGA